MRRKILIADDERMIRAAILGALSPLSEGWEVCAQASNGKEMVELVKSHRPDLCLVDIRMPDLDGLEAIRESRLLVPDAVFLILSGVNDFEHARTALQLGVGDYLLKPIRPEELLDAVRKAGLTIDERHRRRMEELAALCRPGADRSRYSHWRFSAQQWFFDGRASEDGAVHRAEDFRERLRLQGNRQASMVVMALPSTRAPVTVLWGCPMDHPEAEQLHHSTADHVLTLGNAFRSSGSLVTVVSVGSFLRLDDVLFRFGALDKDWLRFPFLATNKAVEFREVMENEPGSEIRPAIAHLVALGEALLLGDRSKFLLHLHGFRRLETSLTEEHPLVEGIRLFAHRVLGVPVRLPVCEWQKYLTAELEVHFESSLEEMGNDHQVVLETLRLVEQEGILDLSIKQLAGRYRLSPNYVSTLFHKHTGTTFVRYITKARMGRALELLSDPHISLVEVARLCGYSSRAYFEKVFVAVHGNPPQAFRREARAVGNSSQTP